MRSTVIVFLFAFIAVFISPGASAVRAEELGDWHDTLEEYTTFWDGKGKISGQVRFRAESFNDFDFDDDVSADARDDDFLLSRIRLAVDLKPHELVRLYFQLQDSHQFETDTPTAFRLGPPAREDRVDIHQAYIDARPIADVPLIIRAGRQELSYGNQKLIGAFGWSNVGRTFKGVKMM
jgi:hypothetical protein